MAKVTPILALMAGLTVIVLVGTGPVSGADWILPRVVLPVFLALFAAYGLTWMAPQKHFTNVFAVTTPICMLYMWGLKMQFVNGDTTNFWIFLPTSLILLGCLLAGHLAAKKKIVCAV